MKKRMILPVIAIVTFLALIAASQLVETSKNYMPYVSYAGKTDTPTPTATNTPKPPEPTPTATPTYIPAEGGNSCVWVWSARRSPDNETKISGQVASLCTKLEIDHFEDAPEGKIVIVRGVRIKTDTWGCTQDDFAPGVEWPPIDYPCPPPELPPDPFPPDQWGWYKSLTIPVTVQWACGYCEECPRPYTLNCVESVK